MSQQKSLISEALSKSEVRFWIGIIAIVLSVTSYGNKITTKLALLEQRVGQLAGVHEQVALHDKEIAIIKTLLKIK